MAAVSAWGKPGAWALDSEENEALEQLRQTADKGYDSSDSAATADFPSLSAAVATKPSKKKNKQTLSLAEFHSAAVADVFTPSRGLTTTELLRLPTGPRERTAEELDRSSRGFGYSSYGGGAGGGRGRGSGDGEESNSRWGSSRVSDDPRKSRDLGPSRADEVDDWGAGKKSGVSFERRERGGGFFDSQQSQSRADDSDSWISKKTTVAPPPDRARERRGGYELFNREGSNGGGVDSDSWGKNKEETIPGGRPRLVLQRRSLPLANDSNGEQQGPAPAPAPVKSKGSNPFGEARPREEVLAEKGQDWKKIDEKLEAVKIQDALGEGLGFGKKGFGMENGSEVDRTERAWKKPDAADGATEKAWRKPEAADGTTERAWRKPEVADGTMERAWRKPEAADGTTERAWRKPEAASGTTERAWRKPHAADDTERAWKKPDAADTTTPRAEKVEEPLPEN